jgi:spore maturation protein CgeB
MKKHLNNDQLIKKANKNVRELGQVASTILTIEIQSLVARRIAELSNGAENINIFHPKQIKDVLKTYLQTFKTEAVVNVFSKEEDEKQFSCESCY